MILRSVGLESDRALNALQSQFGDKYLYSFNSFMPDEKWAIEIYKKSRELKKDIMSIETPLIGRTDFKNIDESIETYHRIGLNYVSSFFYHNYFIPSIANSSRLKDMFEKTNTELKPWRTKGNHVIYAMQIPEDTSLLGLDVFAAAQYDLTMLRRLTDRPIMISLHPGMKRRHKIVERNKRYVESFYEIVRLSDCVISEVSTHDLFQDAWCTICYTSGTAYESIVNGIPAITLSERSFMRPITSTSWYDVENPITPDRIPWLSRIAYCQWNLSEILDGTFKKHVERYLKNEN
jgi:hypothetical protein